MRAQSRCSVVIPTYNRAPLLGQTIDSVLAQTLPPIEIIVVDDGSTDGTAAVVAKYGERVRYVATPNRGVAHARNVGMQEAAGDYLTFLDSDDLLYPYMLELESRVLRRYPDVGFVYAEMSGFDERGFFERFHLRRYHESAYRDPGIGYDHLFSSSVRLRDADLLPPALSAEDPSLLDRRAYFGNIFDTYLTRLMLFTNNVLMRREVAARIGVRNEAVKYYEEFDYTLRMSRDYEVCFVDVPTYKLRYHHGQISTTTRTDGKYVWARKQQILLRVVKRHALSDPDYYRAHRSTIDATLANLHRAAAVPLMLINGGPGWRYTRCARHYLARCRRYGRSHLALWLLTFAPGFLRRFGVTVAEHLSHATRRLRLAAH